MKNAIIVVEHTTFSTTILLQKKYVQQLIFLKGPVYLIMCDFKCDFFSIRQMYSPMVSVYEVLNERLMYFGFFVGSIGLNS